MPKRSRKRRAGVRPAQAAGESSAAPGRAPGQRDKRWGVVPRVAAFAGASIAIGAIIFYFAGLWDKSDDRPPQSQGLNSDQVRFVGGADDGYVDSATCAGCHQEIHETYQHTGMARSFYRPEPGKMVEDFTDRNAYYHPASDRYYTMIERGGEYYQRRHQIDADGGEFNVFEQRIDFVIGSGNHARSYLHLDEHAKLTQMPLGWYSAKGGYWAMSPGYDQPRHKGFGREISFDCMFCHNGYPEMAPGEDARGRDPRYRGQIAQGIDCQRCHGPGRGHLAAIEEGAPEEEIRAAITNPATLSVERQTELCMQCHLETTSRRLPYTVGRADRGAFSFRPGEPLPESTLHFDHAPGQGPEDRFEIAHAAYRLRKSACFQQTQDLPAGQALTCTTCHDPHDIPRGEEAIRHYVGVCNQCHEGSLGRLVANGKHTASSECLDCHMPKRRTDDVVHVVMTDHYIRRDQPEGDLLAALEEKADTPETAYRGEVVPYYPARLDPEDELYAAVAQVVEESNLAGGIPRLEQALAKHKPENGVFYFELAEAYWKAGDADKSIPMYEEAIERNPNHQAALRNFGVALSENGQSNRAVEVLERALRVDPEDSKSLNNLGEVYLRQGQPERAREVLQKAVRIDPHLPEAQTNLALALARTGDRDGALAAAREAIRIQPDYSTAHGNLANLLAATGEVQEAGLHYTKALDLNPDSAETHYNFAGLLAGQQKLPEAERHLRQALRLSPELAGAHNNLGNLLATRGNVSQAIEHFRAAVRAEPNFAEAHFNLGTALGSQGKHREAAEHLGEALRLDPRYQQARLNLGFALAAQGDVAGARVHFDQVAQNGDDTLREAARHALRQIDTR